METQLLHPIEQGLSGTILIVDDDVVNRKILGKIFSSLYNVEEAGDGREGLKKLLSSPENYCAVLLDLLMPGLSGLEVLRYLKAQEIVSSIPVFLITAETRDDVVKEAYRLGVMDVLHKPIISYVVLRRVKSVIELFSARAHLSEVVRQQNKALRVQTEEINKLNRSMIEAMATAIEFRSAEFSGHVQRISQITRILLENTAFGSGMTAQMIEDIALAAVLHDVGKITIPDTVLTKSGSLTPEEHRIMESHTVNGVGILESILSLRESGIYEYACDIARHHHEQWDGGGYPDGLAGDQISPWAQAVALADVYDALNCRRILSTSFSRELVLQTMMDKERPRFNPRLLDCFLSVENQLDELYRDIPPQSPF